MLFANPVSSWIRKWWLYFLLFLIVLAVAIVWLIPSGESTEENPNTAKKLDDLQDKVKTDLILHDSKMNVRKTELTEIKKISDKERRLQALADFGNKGKS